jgi:hypothetical protein
MLQGALRDRRSIDTAAAAAAAATVVATCDM